MFQESEIVCLVLAIPMGVPILLIARRARIPLGFLVAAVAFALAAALFTVLEHKGWPRFFNIVEHLSYAVAGLLAAAGCWRLVWWSRRPPGGGS